MKRFALVALAILAACQKTETPAPPAAATQSAEAPAAAAAPTHAQEVEAWRTRRIERLKAEDGWLSLIGLHWLKAGENDLVVNENKVAKVSLAEGKATLVPMTHMNIDGKPVSQSTVLADDTADNGPTIVEMGTVRFNIIKRGERLGVRVKDANAKTRAQFKGIEMYPVDAKWRAEARLEPYNPPKKTTITDITGMTTEQTIPGALVFSLDGKEYRLDPLDEGDQYFVIFRDETSKDATYPAGRYLYATKPKDGGPVILDFNKAYNPPCAFTPYATCPLPPLQNRLALRVEAGEKKYEEGH